MWAISLNLKLSLLQCEALAESLGGIIHYAHDADYQRSTNSYWSLKNVHVGPGCVIRPAIVEDVSTAVQILSREESTKPGQCQFAVRSGG